MDESRRGSTGTQMEGPGHGHSLAGGAPGELPGSFGWRDAQARSPPSYREAEQGRIGTLERRWSGRFGRVGTYLLFWGAGISAFGLAAIFVRGGPSASPPPWLVGLAAVGLGLAALYVAVANLVNVTRVTLTPSTLIRTDGPLPWRRRVEVLRSQVEIRVTESQRNDARHGAARVPAPPAFDVVGHVTHERSVVLFDLLASREEAELVAAALRARMKRGPG